MIGEFGPESARTINQTSLILYCNSYYEEQSLEEMIAYCYRRCMTYSLYKNLEICKFVKKTLTKYMNRTYIKVILEDLRRLFEKSEPRYLINKMYIDDYLLYVYSMTDELGFNEFI
jgi:protein SHQ1